ncbi:MAG TPA: family 1 encapsulin nanocompartment shell protein [Planctomycetota bacterium]|nr:family 1 encapsulin nanocompartment shell protein [Planctomycetota bacterium]
MTSTSPLTPAQTKDLQDAIVREARRTLVARRFLGIHGPLGAGVDTVEFEEYGPDRDAEIEFVGRHDPEPITATRETFVRVPILYKDFILHWRDIELSKKLAAPLDASRAIRAAHFVANREDELVFNGEPRLKIEGLLNAAGRIEVKRGDWSKYGVVYKNVVAGIEKLLGHNHHRPFALVLSALDYALFVQQRQGQFAPEVDALRQLCDDGVFTTPVIPQGKAVLLSTGDQNFDLAVAEDLTVTCLHDRDQDYLFRVYECLVLRIKRPKAICTIG